MSPRCKLLGFRGGRRFLEYAGPVESGLRIVPQPGRIAFDWAMLGGEPLSRLGQDAAIRMNCELQRD